MTAKSDAPLALITGASSGIGYELAIQFAKAGFDLIIVAENEAIQSAKDALEKMGRSVTAIQADLTSANGVETVNEAVLQGGRRLAAAALNAGVGGAGAFVGGSSFEADLNVIHLNIISTVHLAKLLLPEMVQAGEGRVLFTSSMASLVPGPFHAVYHASKAFIQSFAEAIREELKDSGVTITALLPGATETPFFARAGLLDTKVGQGEKDDPAQVAKQGFEALMRGDDQVIAGSFMNKVQGVMSKVMPDSLSAKQMRAGNEPLPVRDAGTHDAIAMLKSQHREVEALFERIDKAKEKEGLAIFQSLATKLKEHMQIEEEVFYPAAAKVDRIQVAHAKEEHAGAKITIEKILNVKQADAAFSGLMLELKQEIQHHIREEENKLFRECEKAMDKDDLIELADEMRDLMTTIETSPGLKKGAKHSEEGVSLS